MSLNIIKRLNRPYIEKLLVLKLCQIGYRKTKKIEKSNRYKQKKCLLRKNANGQYGNKYKH